MSKDTNEWAPMFKGLAKAFLPAAFTLAVALFLYSELGTQHRMDMHQWGLLQEVPQKGLSLVFIVLISGYFLTAIGTFTYISDLENMSLGAPKPVHSDLSRANKLTIIAAVSLLIFGLSGLYFFDRRSELLDVLHWNDCFLLVVFCLFIWIDLLTSRACKNAEEEFAKPRPAFETAQAIAEVRDSQKRYAEYGSFARNQILYIDIPVVVVIGLNLIGSLLISRSESCMKVDLSGVLNPQSMAAIDGEHLKVLYRVMGQTLVAGLACGMVGAHIIFSQVIFLILRVQAIFKPTVSADSTVV